MKLVVGLGNPGKEYEKTRHNVGFMVVESIFNLKFSILNQFSNSNFQFSKKFNADIVQLDEVLLVKPRTFMNKSGEAVRKVTDFYKVPLDDLWVIHDDLDIVLGDYKIQFGKGPKVHNGITSVEQALGAKEFWRVRIGTEGGKVGLGQEYVLGRFKTDEMPVVNTVVSKVVEDIYGRII